MIVLESKPDPRGGAGAYTLAVLEGVDPDALVKAGTAFAGHPVYLSDGRVIAHVLANGRSPARFRVGRREFPFETPVIELLFDSYEFAKVAEHADLHIEGGRILLVGDDRGPTQKATSTGWGRRLVAGETIRFE
jgi:hypothetical protein